MGANTERGLAVLLCHAGSLIYGLPLEHVLETMRPLPCAPLAGMPAFVSGISIVRGAPLPVIDLARLFGDPSQSQKTRLVIIKVEERRIALAVESVVGVQTLDLAASDVLPPLLQGADTELIRQIGCLDARLLVVLESGKIVPASLWASLRREFGQAA
jgi:purine-binding chemotaxis protein CheW